ncbi:BTAD domain-containing putative transcriptional regulator [Microlunatus ginsengisoli]|uniref:OmpR/PhoB-type domain-containing protein n=1 Tax=Microlunatus ginsengisoli TaxID=363863 RepID=A0ABP7AS29_9ACTN
MDSVILVEKVRRPDPRGLVRDRLEHRLAASDAAPIGLVLGPPGSGKTTVLSRVAGSSVEPTAWYRAGAEDDDEAALVRHLAYGIGATLPDLDVAPVVGSGSIDVLLAALEADGRPIRLVVDDLHAIAGTRAEAALERVATLRPRQLRMILASRRPPAINTTRLMLDGELEQLDGEDLRFRSWEVEELFRTVYQRPLSPEAAAALTRRTGGWAAGLQLFHLATARLSRTDRERAIDELTGRTRLIRSYLARNVVDGLAAERRRFLLHTCTLGVLTGELCDALLDTPGSAALLDQLEREQFFTTSTDGGLTFRYHQVLQTHLEVVLVDELGAQATRELYARSAALLEGDRRTMAAVRAYARAEDWGSVARLLHQGGSALPPDEEWWSGVFGRPGAPADDPGIVVAGARRLLRNGLIADAVAAYRHAETLMDDLDFTARCAHERAVAQVWLPQPVGLEPGRPRTAERDLRLSLELRTLTRTLRAPSATQGLAAGLGRLLAGDLGGAARAVAEPSDEVPRWEQLAARLIGQLAELLGQPDEESAGRLEEIVLTADVDAFPWLSRVARGVQAALWLAMRPSEWRIAACADLIEDCVRHRDEWATCLLTGLVGAAHALAGRADLAVPLLRRSAECANRLTAPVLQLWAEAIELVVERGSGMASDSADPAPLLRSAESLGLTAVARLLTGAELPAWTEPRPLVDETAEPPAVLPPATAERAAGSAARLQCLGSFALLVGGDPVPWGGLRPRARSLLMLLALRAGEPVHREELIEAVWPEATLASGTRSLQVAVSSVRQWLATAGLPEDSLRRQSDAYALCLPGVTVDVRRFEELARAATGTSSARPADGAGALAAYQAALDAYRGDLLPEVGPAEWVIGERDRLRTLAAHLAADAARAAQGGGNTSAGIAAARRSIELDPYHDPAWRLLAELLDSAGDHSAAAVARREHARVCAELGVPVP